MLRAAAGGALALTLGPRASAAVVARPPLPLATWRALPRWRGFNLPYKMTELDAQYSAWDFDFIARFGFNFVRLPLDDRLWINDINGRLTPVHLTDVDEAIRLARARRIHVNLALFAARFQPWGTPPALDIWADGPRGERARRRFSGQWRSLARRYRRVPSRELSFNLLNEPSGQTYWDLGRSDRVRVYTRLIAQALRAIREEDPRRLVIVDAMAGDAARLAPGRTGDAEGYITPLPEARSLRVAQSLHVYLPALLTMYRVSGVPGSDRWPVPTWPYTDSSPVSGPSANWVLPGPWTKERIRAALAQWGTVRAAGSGVHVGEFGCHNKTPHDVALAWMRDVLDVIRERKIGWALWQLRGPLGVVDSGRDDVEYERYRGHLIDRRMLDLLRSR